jgi:hypothetical protein
MLVAVEAVIHMGQNMKGVAGEIARGCGHGAEGDVAAVAREDFEFVEAGFGAGRFEDREADEAGRRGGEAIDVFPVGDGATQCPDPRLGQEPTDLNPPILTRLLGGERHLALTMLDAGEHRLEPVVVGLRNGVELVVVAACTADREPEKCRACRAHHVVELVGPLVGRQDRIGRLHLIPGTADEETGGDVGAARVTGELGTDEGVVGEIALEALDHPVAVAPGVGAHLVHLEAVALGETHGVEPVPGPAFAEAPRGEETVDEIGEGGLGAASGAVGRE